jgi:hypothetical protein
MRRFADVNAECIEDTTEACGTVRVKSLQQDGGWAFLRKGCVNTGNHADLGQKHLGEEFDVPDLRNADAFECELIISTTPPGLESFERFVINRIA